MTRRTASQRVERGLSGVEHGLARSNGVFTVSNRVERVLTHPAGSKFVERGVHGVEQCRTGVNDISGCKSSQLERVQNKDFDVAGRCLNISQS